VDAAVAEVEDGRAAPPRLFIVASALMDEHAHFGFKRWAPPPSELKQPARKQTGEKPRRFDRPQDARNSTGRQGNEQRVAFTGAASTGVNPNRVVITATGTVAMATPTLQPQPQPTLP
jgi:hypothetical protein